ncbi:MAG: hypothetical protein ACXU9A_01165, partial [Xanthobacteraceae bacterium]
LPQLADLIMPLLWTARSVRAFHGERLLLLVNLRDNELEVALTHVAERKHGRARSRGSGLD